MLRRYYTEQDYTGLHLDIASHHATAPAPDFVFTKRYSTVQHLYITLLNILTFTRHNVTMLYLYYTLRDKT